MNTQNLNIVSPKSLEKQLKIVESRVQELQAEIHELEKIRTACLILLGTAAEFPPEKEAADAALDAVPAKATKKKSDKRAAASEETDEEASSPESQDSHDDNVEEGAVAH